MDRSESFVLVGGVEAGKSTLFNALFDKKEAVRKTQAVEFETDRGVDTPGEFFSHPRLYHALLQTVADVGTIVYVHDCSDVACRLPPGLLNVYAGKRIVGVISKTDRAECDPDAAERLLREHGIAGPIFRVSAYEPETLAELREFLLG
jgi:ethanolamine utilization protein EutP